MANSGTIKLRLKIAALGLSAVVALAPRPSYAGHGNGDQGDKHGHGKHGEYYWQDQHGQHHKHHKHGRDYESNYGYQAYDYRGPYFTQQRITIIRNYYTPEEIERLPPGLRKHLERTGHLPPGLEKKLVVNQPLPPGYLDYMVPAPPQLVNSLGPLPPDSRLYFYNGDAVLINPKTQAVMDIMHGVLTLGGY
jgi:hypothetical protein